MPKKVFYSFHYDADNWRAGMIRNIGVIEGNPAVSDNDWEAVKRGGDAAITRWIDNQLLGRACTVVLIGSNTTGRKWIEHEIKESWNKKKGLVGIHIHNLKDRWQTQSSKGSNPFDKFHVNGVSLANIVRTYDPPYYSSTDVYNYISRNLENWVDEAISIRNRYN